MAEVQGPVHVEAEVVATKRIGGYRHLTLTAPGVPERFRAGNFVAVTVDGPRRAPRPVGAPGARVQLLRPDPRRGGREPRRRDGLARRPAGRHPPRADRAARPPLRAAEGRRVVPARRRGVRRRTPLPAGRATARARLRRLARRLRARRGATARRPRGPAVGALRHGDHRRRLRRPAGHRRRPRRRPAPAQRRRRRLRRRPHGRPACRGGRRRAGGRVEPGRGGGAHAVRHRPLPRLPAPGGGGGRRGPRRPRLRRRPRRPRRPRALGAL